MKSFFCICSLLWSDLNVLAFFPLTGGCSEGLGAFCFLFYKIWYYYREIKFEMRFGVISKEVYKS